MHDWLPLLAYSPILDFFCLHPILSTLQQDEVGSGSVGSNSVLSIKSSTGTAMEVQEGLGTGRRYITLQLLSLGSPLATVCRPMDRWAATAC